MDQQKLRSLVFEKTGVKIDLDDPIFALVALNEAVLEDAVERHIAAIDAASRELAQQARLAGGLAPHGGRQTPSLDAGGEAEPASASARSRDDAQETKAGAATRPITYAPTPAAPVRAIATQSGPLVTPRELRLLGAAAVISILSALVVLAGQAAFARPPTATLPATLPAALSPQQAQALQDAEKIRKAIATLDPKTRSLLPAELQP